jgi:hypothetical protein
VGPAHGSCSEFLQTKEAEMRFFPLESASSRDIQRCHCRLLTKVCSKLFNRNVTDIGACVPPEVAEFFNGCGFDLDKYNSVAMRLDRSSPAAQLSIQTNASYRDAERMAWSCKMQRVEEALKRYTNLAS